MLLYIKLNFQILILILEYQLFMYFILTFLFIHSRFVIHILITYFKFYI